MTHETCTMKPQTIRLSIEYLQRALGAVKCAVSDDKNRYVLNGVHATCDGAVMRLTATDGRRLHTCPVDSTIYTTGIDAQNPVDAIFPASMVAALSSYKVAPKTLRMMTLAFVPGNDVHYVHAEIDVLALSGRQVEGRFPDARQIIPETMDNTWHFDNETRAAWISAVNACLPYVSKKATSIRVQFMGCNGARLSAINPESGEFSVDVSASRERGDFSEELAFNPHYLLDALKSFDGAFTFGVNSSVSPCKMWTGDDIRVVMPMRL